MLKFSMRTASCKALLLLSLSATTATLSLGQEQHFREVSGSVRDQHGHPLNKAIVQLENEDTHALETYIADGDGAFHFKHVSSDTDYEVWARFNGKESKKFALSKFNDKSSVALRLVVEF